MTYNERIRAIAEEMAGGPLKNMREFWKIAYLQSARIAVKHMREQFEQACILVFDGEKDQPEYITYMDQCKMHMKEQGLIPSDGQGAGER